MEVKAIHAPEDLDRYLNFAAEVYRGNPFWIAPDRHHMLDLLGGKSPHASHSQIQPFLIESNARVRATVTAVVDHSFNQYWNELAGHLFFFEALPDAGDASRELLRVACDWLSGRKCRFARLSFLYGWQLPLTTDAYDAAPTLFHTYNPPVYHRLVKDAGFFSEKGQLEYQVRFNADLAAGYRNMVEQAARAGVRLRSWDFSRIEAETQLFLDIVNRAFAGHWGAPQHSFAEIAGLTVGLKGMLVPDFTAFAEFNGQPVGAVLSLPDLHQAQRGLPIDHGVLLVISVNQEHRGKGINLALAARSYLAMMDHGYKSASYTIVLDDNWPSRRTAEKLGCRVARNFLVYRKNL